jgi:catechol 2,3-dioxygenase-like lactoylglutathione lyase family enzyme
MFSHVMVGSNDIDRSKRFYDALFSAIGAHRGRQDDRGRLSYLHKVRHVHGQPPD